MLKLIDEAIKKILDEEYGRASIYISLNLGLAKKIATELEAKGHINQEEIDALLGSVESESPFAARNKKLLKHMAKQLERKGRLEEKDVKDFMVEVEAVNDADTLPNNVIQLFPDDDEDTEGEDDDDPDSAS